MGMQFRYPRLCNWLIFRDAGDGACLVTDAMEDTCYRFDNRIAWFIQQLDGRRDPYAISPQFTPFEVETVLAFLEQHHLLRSGRVAASFLGSVYFSLWIPPLALPRRRLAAALNRLLGWLFLPILALGLYTAWAVPWEASVPDDALVYLACAIPGLIVGMLCHEIAHAAAAIAYGGTVFEIGVGFSRFMPSAYTMMENEWIRNRLHLAQIDAAGVEMNLLLAGLCLLLLNAVPSLNALLWVSAMVNISLALLNLCLIDGLDGMNMLSHLLNVTDLAERAKEAVLNGRTRRALLREGKESRLTLWVYALVTFFQIGSPVILLLNLLGVVLWML